MTTHPTPQPPDRDPTDPVDAALAGALSRAGEDLCEVPDDVARGHLDAITALAADHAHTMPAPARGPGSSWTAWRLRLRRVAGMTAAKVAFGVGVAAAGTTGGMAATGSLPGPVQQVVSDGAGWFGIQLPSPAIDAISEADDPDADTPRGTTDAEATTDDAGTRPVPERPVMPDPAPGDDTPPVAPEDRADDDAEDGPPADEPADDQRPAEPGPPEEPPADEPPADRAPADERPARAEEGDRPDSSGSDGGGRAEQAPAPDGQPGTDEDEPQRTSSSPEEDPDSQPEQQGASSTVSTPDVEDAPVDLEQGPR